MSNIRYPFKLKSWIDPNSIPWKNVARSTNYTSICIIEQYVDKLDKKSLKELCNNPNAITIIEKNINKLDKECFKELCKNHNAIHILEKHIDKIDWYELSKNSNAFHLLNNNPDKIDIHGLLFNNNCIYFLEKYFDKYFLDKIDLKFLHEIVLKTDNIYISIIEKCINKLDDKCWDYLSLNMYAIKILERNIDKINWGNLCTNPNAISILEENINMLNSLCWASLSSNDNAISILEKNIDKIDWFSLTAYNNNCFKILQNYPDKISWHVIYWDNLSFDHPIFEIDYKYLEERCNIYKEELMQKALHPKRIEKYLSEYGIIIEELENYI